MLKTIIIALTSIIASFMLLVGISEAGDLSYDCEIKYVYNLTEDGLLKVSGWKNKFKGNLFSISRETGTIAGKVLTTILAKETRVVNYGSKENSFKAVATFNGQFQLIEIQEFKEGQEKPFVASSMGGAGIVTGVCK